VLTQVRRRPGTGYARTGAEPQRFRGSPGGARRRRVVVFFGGSETFCPQEYQLARSPNRSSVFRPGVRKRPAAGIPVRGSISCSARLSVRGTDSTGRGGTRCPADERTWACS